MKTSVKYKIICILDELKSQIIEYIYSSSLFFAHETLQLRYKDLTFDIEKILRTFSLFSKYSIFVLLLILYNQLMFRYSISIAVIVVLLIDQIQYNDRFIYIHF